MHNFKHYRRKKHVPIIFCNIINLSYLFVTMNRRKWIVPTCFQKSFWNELLLMQGRNTLIYNFKNILLFKSLVKLEIVVCAFYKQVKRYNNAAPQTDVSEV